MSVTTPWGLLISPQATFVEKAQALSHGWMSESEQYRLTSQKSAARHSSFSACRYALRLLLAEDERHIALWRLGSVAEQKPWVEISAPGEHISSLQLSLSHSGKWLACAKAPIPIGVDLEVQVLGRQRNIHALADQVCARTEQDQLKNLPCEMQQEYFFQLWCLKEAYFKCLGIGLDFSQVKKKVWHKTASLPSIYLKNQAAPPPVAYGNLWQACLEDGSSIYLALSAQQKLPVITPFQASQSLIKWQSCTEWRLYDAV